MALINITVHNYCTEDGENEIEILKTKIEQLMATYEQLKQELEGLNQKVSEFKTAVDAEQEQVSNELARLNTLIQQLEDQIANGATPEQLEGLLTTARDIRDGLQASQDDLKNTIPDVQPPTTGTTDTQSDL